MAKRPSKPASSNAVIRKTSTVQTTTFQGPIPHPAFIEHYEKIVPSAGERILKMAEDQQAHRHKMEHKAIESESRNSFLGILSAFLIGMTTVICGSIVAYAGKEWPGYAISGTGLVTLVGTFIYGTSTRRKERQQRVQAMQKM